MEPKMILFIGIQASGKSSFYRKYLSDYEHISLDVLNTRNKERLAIEECIAKGKSFVIDNTNPTKADRKRYFDRIAGKDYQAVGYFFRSVISESIERNEQRTGKQYVPRCAIAATSNKLEMPTFEEGFTELYYVYMKDGDFVVEEWREEA
ncbi:MAG: AAA family ATPase [Lachnospiraceae bacterium]|nr:AAA family ATPase [Lachnospiraceae bacterium]